MRIIGWALAASLVGGGAWAAGPSAALKPTRVAGSGFWVRDLAAERAWYEDKLGMTVAAVYPPKPASGPAPEPFEYVMSFGGGPDAAVLALAKSANRPAGPNTFSRAILIAPDAKALAAELAAGGVTIREVVPGAAYFATDPEGNTVELYTPPKR